MTGRSKAAADENTQQRVRRSAVELFAKQGFNGTGIRDIATAAGLTTSTLYHYMSTKDDLLVDVMLSTITPLRDAAVVVLDDIDDPAAQVATLVEHHVWMHATERIATLVADTELRALSGERRDQILVLRDEYEEMWRTAIREGVTTGVFFTDHSELAAQVLLQMATGISHWFQPEGKLDLGELCRSYSDWALALLRAERGPGKPIHRGDLDLVSPTHYLPR